MHVRIYEYVCICMNLCGCMCVFVCVEDDARRRVYVHRRTGVYVSVLYKIVRVCISASRCKSVCVCMHACMYIGMYECMHAWTFVCYVMLCYVM